MSTKYYVEAGKTVEVESLKDAVQYAYDKIKERSTPEVQIYDHRYRMVREYIAHNGNAVCVFNSY